MENDEICHRSDDLSVILLKLYSLINTYQNYHIHVAMIFFSFCMWISNQKYTQQV